MQTHKQDNQTGDSPVPVIRLLIAGAMMGLANLVPGISGGTMLVACGVYRRFIDAVSDATRFRFSRATLITLGLVIVGAGLAIAGLASVIYWALVEFRWAMYALFIGLTLGGVPLLWKLARPVGRATWVGLVCGALAMGGLVLVQELGGGGSGVSGPAGLVIGGAAAAGAMILPGVSGAFLLLLLGQYERIIGAIKDTVSAAKDADVSGVIDQMGVVIPIGIGVLIGVIGVANLLRWVMHRYERATLGVLLGLLIAAPAGLYPFRQGVPPQVGDTIKGELVTEANLEEMRSPDQAKDWAQKSYAPNAAQLGGAVGLIVLGFGATMLLARLGSEDEPGDEARSAPSEPAA